MYHFTWWWLSEFKKIYKMFLGIRKWKSLILLLLVMWDVTNAMTELCQVMIQSDLMKRL
jgi:hypothetical protein